MAGDGRQWQRLPISSSGECVDPRQALDFVRRLRHSSLGGGDRQAVMAVMEILVRRCVYPHLSPGVGIPLRKRFRNPSAIAGAAAAASEIDPHREDEIKELEEGFDALDKSVELLWELVVDSEGGELREIVLSHHLPDLWAGIFQLSHNSDDEAATSGKIHTLVEALPVAHAVEALMILLAKENSPPPWLEAHAGKILSRLVMRQGGVAAVLERLVGNAAQGDVSVQKRVATHLAKCPKFVGDPDKYYSSVCSQVLEIISLPTTSSSDAGESAARAVSNMYHTSIAMVCAIARRKPGAVEDFVVDPLVEPLLQLDSKLEGQAVQSLFKVSAIATAGDRGIREMIVRKTKAVTPRLLLLHRLVLGDGKPNPSAALSDRDRLRAAVGDLVLVHLTQPPGHCLAVCWSYIVEFSVRSCCWQWPDAGIDLSTSVSKSPGRGSRHLLELVMEAENPALADGLVERASSKIAELEGDLEHEDNQMLVEVCRDVVQCFKLCS
ncbi:transport and Golgi organization protein 6 homolog isoform X1 [Selaginella moellendorffii]|uniref:transport and Golgi organization protein 6 homolog isoform X1 n=1 Tax=Selaginella moellendorffii TaxID=88036 RepID=UPI000D1CCE38|nr:transport and Golgi organization protein 6 homolog isoform X1 [Selaginella moellendorffii]XP_024541397.1 transport and Golgi organization protein 6 homolog isoform X1 [Selaginella moellendorffii]XP_024541398.1 transport and Golgi organization protein 6 homolog isoform X1 [Selaginella moellendorffii]|eukprot:XP_024541396.1 transport and Golgi organization protein 6 homolog isoform X1 [Selaginella moellendorffii]